MINLSWTLRGEGGTFFFSFHEHLLKMLTSFLGVGFR